MGWHFVSPLFLGGERMLFSSITFLYYFLPCVILLYYITPKKLKNLTLLLSSLFFYAWGEPKYIILMAVGTLNGYIAGLLIEKFIGTKIAKAVLWISAIINIGCLGYFKYADFFIDNIKNYLQMPDYKDCIIVSTMDAGRDEIYYQTYNINKEKLSDSKAEKISENSFTELLDSNSLIFIGNASTKVEKILNANQKLFFVHQIEPLAQYFPILSHKQYLDKDFVDVAYFEPFYLKDFIATISKKNPLQKNY